jgi:hypothetical protein
MSGTVTPLGAVTVGGCIPTSVAAFGAVEGNINAELAVAGSATIALDLGPPSVAFAAAIGADFADAMSASVTEPYFGLQVDANLALIAELNAQLAAIAGIIAALGTAGVFLYKYNGTADSFGTELQAVVGSGIPGGSPTDHIDALVLIASTPAAWAAIQTVMKTT